MTKIKNCLTDLVKNKWLELLILFTFFMGLIIHSSVVKADHLVRVGDTVALEYYCGSDDFLVPTFMAVLKDPADVTEDEIAQANEFFLSNCSVLPFVAHVVVQKILREGRSVDNFKVYLVQVERGGLVGFGLLTPGAVMKHATEATQ